MTLVDKICLNNNLYSGKNTPIVILIYSLKTPSLPHDLLFFKEFVTSIISASLNSWSSSRKESVIFGRSISVCRLFLLLRFLKSYKIH